MDIDELCAAVNSRLEEEGIEVTDGRTSHVVTPRHVRYYRTIALLPAPRREGRRAAYDDRHLAMIVAIKTAQANGTSLEDLRRAMGDAGPEAQPEKVEFRPSDYEEVALASERAMTTSFAAMHRVESHYARASMEGPMAALRNAWQSLATTENDDARTPPQVGWSVRVGRAVLSGFGTPPSTDQIERLRDVLDQGEGDREDRGTNGPRDG